MKNVRALIIGSILILGLLFAGCTDQQNNDQQNDVDTSLKQGTLKLKITDKPGDLNIIHANVTISTVQVHKSNETDEEETDNGEEDFANSDEFEDGFIADGDGPYTGDIGEDINFEGNATEGLDEPYNWSWDFGDGNISYEQNPTHNYSNSGDYIVNLTVTNNTGNGVKDWYLTIANIGEDDEGDESIAGWYTIVEESQEFDLIALQNVTDIIGEDSLSAGKYTQIRLTVEKAELTINNSDEIDIHEMMIPSGTVKLIKPFWINEDETTELTLDFDVYESVHQTGNNKFIMRPTIKVIEG